MEYIVAYLVGAVIVNGLFAYRIPHEDCRNVFWISLFWPASILVAVLVLCMDAIKWNFDVVKGAKMFGFRRPTNPEAKGFAITVFGQEAQFYKVG
jgi:hypothetical protein